MEVSSQHDTYVSNRLIAFNDLKTAAIEYSSVKTEDARRGNIISSFRQERGQTSQAEIDCDDDDNSYFDITPT